MSGQKKKGFLSKIIPANYLEEKEAFFADNSYNPQFEYLDEFDADKLTEYGFPKERYLEKARRILKDAYADGTTEEDLLKNEGRLLSEDEVTHRTQRFLELHNLEKQYTISWSKSYVSRASITADTIKFKSGSRFENDSFSGLLFHEIGTHALRRLNYEQQPWYKRKKKHGLLNNYLTTEEGLACIHSLLPRKNKRAWFTAANYVTLDFALKHSFAETWDFVGQYIQDDERRWTAVVKLKRGFTDTSQPGCYTKNITYFEGLVDVWKWLKNHQFDPTLLYYGKVHHEDITKAVALNPTYTPQLPSFYVSDPGHYRQQLEEIGTVNYLQ